MVFQPHLLRRWARILNSIKKDEKGWLVASFIMSEFGAKKGFVWLKY